MLTATDASQVNIVMLLLPKLVPMLLLNSVQIDVQPSAMLTMQRLSQALNNFIFEDLQEQNSSEQES